MLPLRVIRSRLLLTGLMLAFAWPLRAAEGGFVNGLSEQQKTEAGLTELTADELLTLDGLVAGDIARTRQLKTSALPGAFSSRHPEPRLVAAGLNRLTYDQLAKLNELVDAAVYVRPTPRERPRLKDDDVLSEKGRLQVHGGMSFTYGWAGGGRNFRETAAWVSYYDPVTGLGLGFGFSNLSGDLYPGYYYDRDFRYGRNLPYHSVNPRSIWGDLPPFAAERNEPPLRGTGESLRARQAVNPARGY
ncbi:MAG TPA: hypothetical protein VHN79_10875 [Lacunisphaera sp.]|nr:hypothetical protein [Lacunisphaera sp.]